MDNGNKLTLDKLKKKRRKIWSAIIFIVLVMLTVHIVFSDTDIDNVFNTIFSMNKFFLLLSVSSALFFVVIEGIIIWYLLRSLNGRSGILKCISYGFIGFFFSGITPSATGGQPMQLYYMKRDGNRLSDSTAVLMIVALSYKLVLVLFGIGIATLWNSNLRHYLDNYYVLYIIGLILNILLVMLIIMVMTMPKVIKKLVGLLFRFLVFIKILKPSKERTNNMYAFVDSYSNAVTFIKNSKRKVVYITFLAFIQRISAFSLTYFVYRGFGMSAVDWITVAGIQAAIYISVDLLPLPGAQGITEIMYKSVFVGIFTSKFLVPSLVVTRFLNFYFLLIVSLGVIALRYIVRRIRLLTFRES